VAAGGDSVILANWVRRSERLALSENGDGTTIVAFNQSGAKQGIKMKLQMCFEVGFDEKNEAAM